MVKKILLIYYNQNHDTYYHHFCHPIDLHIHDYYIGFRNAYYHELVSIILIDGDKTIIIKDYNDYLTYYNQKNKNIKNDLIDKTISLLNRLKR